MTINIISVGTKPSANLLMLIDDYTNRLPRHIKLKWQYIKHGNGNVSTSKQQESESILRLLPKEAKIILLDEGGIQLSSEELSKSLFEPSFNTVFIIGGAYGVSDEVKKRADLTMSLSKLVLPHQIVRLVLTEQIYRSYTISINHPYHHS